MSHAYTYYHGTHGEPDDEPDDCFMISIYQEPPDEALADGDEAVCPCEDCAHALYAKDGSLTCSLQHPINEDCDFFMDFADVPANPLYPELVEQHAATGRRLI